METRWRREYCLESHEVLDSWASVQTEGLYVAGKQLSFAASLGLTSREWWQPTIPIFIHEAESLPYGAV